MSKRNSLSLESQKSRLFLQRSGSWHDSESDGNQVRSLVSTGLVNNYKAGDWNLKKWQPKTNSILSRWQCGDSMVTVWWRIFMIYISIKSGGLTCCGPVYLSYLTRDGSALGSRPPPGSHQLSEARGAEGDQDQWWEDIHLFLHHQLQCQGLSWHHLIRFLPSPPAISVL